MKFAGVLAALLCAGLLPGQVYRISGTVVNGVTGAPLERVKVLLAPTSERTRIVSVTTGANGRFVFADLAAGKWILTASRRGYLSQSFGQHPSLSDPGIAVVTGPDELTEDLVFRMHPPGTIRGKVMDINGEPVEAALVQVLSWVIANGRKRVLPIRSGWTNDDGGYALAPLAAGSYFIAVTGRPWYVDERSYADGQSPMRVGFPPHFYPNTTDPRAAAPVQLRSGEEITADFALAPAPAVALSLKVRGEPVRIMLSAEGVQGAPTLIRTPENTSAGYTLHLTPGRYTAWFGTDKQEQPRTQTIELGTHDEEVELVGDEPAKAEVTIEAEGIGDEALGALGLAVYNASEGRAMSRMIPPGRVLKFSELPPGRLRLRLAGPGWNRACISRVSVEEGARYTGGELEVLPGASARIRVGISGKCSSIEGHVYRGGRAVSGAGVGLAPQTGADQDYRFFVSDSDGSYEFEAVKPGEYTLFVVENGSELEYANSAAIAPYLKSGQTVRVETGAQARVRLELPAPASPHP